MAEIRIGNKRVGDGQPVFVVAEMGINHNKDMKIAKGIIDAAVSAGADAVKFQKYNAYELSTVKAPKAKYQDTTTAPGESQYELLKRLQLSKEDIIELTEYADKHGIISFVTPFDRESADFLDSINVCAFKIGSGDIADLPFLEYVAKKNKPIILSTGMSYLSEVDEAVRTVFATGNKQLLLLHCTSNYPARVEDANLAVIKTLKEAFGLPVGYSDHIMNGLVAVVAVSMGAVLIEKHLTVSRKLSGPDQHASFEPDEFKEYVKNIRLTQTVIGRKTKEPVDAEYEIRKIAFKSLVATREIRKGTVITEDMLTSKRPGTGILSKHREFIIGRKAVTDIKEDEIITWDMV